LVSHRSPCATLFPYTTLFRSQRVEVRDLLDLVAEERDAIRGLGMRRLHLDHVALHAEAAAAEQRVVADVLDVDELAQHHVAVLRSEEHTSELQSLRHLVCRLL